MCLWMWMTGGAILRCLARGCRAPAAEELRRRHIACRRPDASEQLDPGRAASRPAAADNRQRDGVHLDVHKDWSVSC